MLAPANLFGSAITSRMPIMASGYGGSQSTRYCHTGQLRLHAADGLI